MKTPTFFKFLSPTAARARLKGTSESHREGGFSLIETMAAMAIIAILALAIVPQFGKYMERAAVQNVINDISSAQLLVESDHGLTGTSIYAAGDVAASVAATVKNPTTTLSSTVVGSTGYTITATSTQTPNYTIKYDNATSILAVKRVS
ncbi:MAG TPA: prepilin-type N-terminal cleavage/methylation domain-containing protein [Arthrobacter sp.]